jgi:hypothetical protein
MITAQQVLNSIGARLRAEQLKRLDDLPPGLRSRVLRALTVLPSYAAIDIERLVLDCQRQAEDAQAVLANSPRPGSAWKFWLLSVATSAQARMFRDMIAGGRTVEKAYATCSGAAGRATSYVARPSTYEPPDDDTPP